jgi:hypothetical protein
VRTILARVARYNNHVCGQLHTSVYPWVREYH